MDACTSGTLLGEIHMICMVSATSADGMIALDLEHDECNKVVGFKSLC